MSINKMLPTVVCIGMLTLALGACERQGPAERAGEEIDETVKEAGEAMEKAGNKAKEAIEEAGKAMEKAGDKAKEETEQ